MKSTILRISLAGLFCLGMFVTANPTALGQVGGRKRCKEQCQDNYKEQMRDCNGKRGKAGRECKERAGKELRKCKLVCTRTISS